MFPYHWYLKSLFRKSRKCTCFVIKDFKLVIGFMNIDQFDSWNYVVKKLTLKEKSAIKSLNFHIWNHHLFLYVNLLKFRMWHSLRSNRIFEITCNLAYLVWKDDRLTLDGGCPRGDIQSLTPYNGSSLTPTTEWITLYISRSWFKGYKPGSRLL